MNKRELIIVEGKNVARMAGELCRRASLADMIRKKCGNTDPLIALKPNLVGPIPAGDGATTHPEIAEAVLSYLKRNGFSRLVVMESSWVGDRTSDSLLVTGFGELCRRMEVPFWDLQEDRGVSVDAAGMKLNICERVRKADYLISLPVLKGHCQTRMTCALKNMKGCIPASEKRRFHRMGLHDPIGHLAAAVHQDFIIADAICPDLVFEDGRNPVQLDRMICAADPVLMDAYGSRALGLKREEVEYIGIAAELGAGCPDAEQAEVSFYLEKKEHEDLDRTAGPDAQETEKEITYVRAKAPDLPWNRDPGSVLIRLREHVDEVDSCSACCGTLIPVLQRLEQEGLLDRIPDKICIGQGYRGKTGYLGIGNCTAHFRHTLKGCPPSSEEMYRFLSQLDV
ncbi:MAG: DUF362 domain-containing protein [Lachnospiraceae bacterium]|nr:DUF362 domain-containing protein [Lachnospiraceae bacterium]